MIRPLRRRHPVLIALIGLIGIPLYVMALLARPEPPVQASLPATLTEPAPAPGGGPVVELPTTPPIQVRRRTSASIETGSTGALEGADLLLYWAPADAPTVPAGYLLGSLRGGERQVFTTPDAALTTNGVLIVYSLAHGERVASVDWPASRGNER